MTNDEQRIQGVKVTKWEFYMALFDDQSEPLRGVRIEPDEWNQYQTWR